MECSNLALKRCSKCNVGCYCSDGCQKTHWQNHKLVCRLFCVAKDDSRNLIKQQLSKEDSKRKLALWIQEGLRLLECGSYDFAIAYFQLVRLGATELQENKWIAEAIENMGIVRYKRGEFDEALNLYQQSYDIKKGEYGDVASTLCNAGIVWNEKGEFDTALNLYQESLDIMKREYGDESNEVVIMLSNIGDVWYQKGEIEKSLNLYLQSLCIIQRRFEYDNKKRSHVLGNIANVCREKGEYDKALDLYQQCLDLNKQEYGNKSKEVATILHNMGTVLLEKREFEKALDLYQQSLDLKKLACGIKSAQVAIALHNIGNIFKETGEFDKAMNFYQQSLDIRKNVFGCQSKQVASTLGNMGNVWLERAEFDKALYLYQQSLEIDKRVFGNESKQVASTLANIGNVLNVRGEYNKALGFYEQSLNINTQKYGKRSKEVAKIMGNIGNVLENRGDYEDALNLYQQSLEIGKHVFGDKSREIAITLGNIGNVRSVRREFDAALILYQQALDIFQQIYGNKSKEVASTVGNIGNVWREKENCERAIEHHQQSLEIYKNVLGEDSREYNECIVKIGRCVMESYRYDGDDCSRFRKGILIMLNQTIHIDHQLIMDHHTTFTLPFTLHHHINAVDLMFQLLITTGDMDVAVSLFNQELGFLQGVESICNISIIPIIMRLMSRWKQMCYVDERIEVSYQNTCEELADRLKYHMPIPASRLYYQSRKSPAVMNKLKQLQMTLYQRLRDEDFLIQLKRTEIGWQKVQLKMIEDMAESGKLSAQVLNYVTELIIRLLHLLDQSFGRFLRIRKQIGEVYFPVKKSESSMNKQFREKGICGVKFISLQKEDMSELQNKLFEEKIIPEFCQSLIEKKFIISRKEKPDIWSPEREVYASNDDHELFHDVAHLCCTIKKEELKHFKTKSIDFLKSHLIASLKHTKILMDYGISGCQKGKPRFLANNLNKLCKKAPPQGWDNEFVSFWDHIPQKCLNLLKNVPFSWDVDPENNLIDDFYKELQERQFITKVGDKIQALKPIPELKTEDPKVFENIALYCGNHPADHESIEVKLREILLEFMIGSLQDLHIVTRDNTIRIEEFLKMDQNAPPTNCAFHGFWKDPLKFRKFWKELVKGCLRMLANVKFSLKVESDEALMKAFLQLLFEKKLIDRVDKVNPTKQLNINVARHRVYRRVADCCDTNNSSVEFQNALKTLLLKFVYELLLDSKIIAVAENLYIDTTSLKNSAPMGWPTDLQVYWPHFYALLNDMTEKAPAIDIKFPEIWGKIKEEQPFTYYKEDKLDATWLDVIYCIANDSKHVRLTPSFAVKELQRKKGLLDFCTVTVEIEYAEPLPQLYYWALYRPILSSLVDISKMDAKNLSWNAIKVLRESGMFTRNREGDLEYWIPRASISEILVKEKLRNHKYESVSKDILSNYFDKYCDIVWEYVRNKKERLYGNGSEIYPDYRVDLHWLMDTAILKVKEIVSLLAQESSTTSFNIIPLKETSTILLDDKKDVLLRMKDLARSTSPQSLAQYHRLLKLAASSKIFTPLEIKQLWKDAAELPLKRKEPELDWLTNRWLAKSARLLCVSAVSKEDVGTNAPAKRTERSIKPEKLDIDLHMQLQYVKEQLDQIRYWSLDLTLGWKGSVGKASCQAVEVVIKLRQLLDQGLARFVHRCIALPKGTFCLQAKFPLFGSKSRLIKELEDLGCHGIEIQYPDLFLLIEQCQPYWYANQIPLKLEESWLEDMVQISNEAKHVRHLMPTKTQLEAYLNNAKSIDDLLPCSVPESHFYSWSFFEECNNDLQKSQNLYKALQNKKWIDHYGRVDNGTLSKIHNLSIDQLKEMGNFLDNDDNATKVLNRIQSLLLPVGSRNHLRTIAICSLIHRAILNVEAILNKLADYIANTIVL